MVPCTLGLANAVSRKCLSFGIHLVSEPTFTISLDHDRKRNSYIKDTSCPLLM